MSKAPVLYPNGTLLTHSLVDSQYTYMVIDRTWTSGQWVYELFCPQSQEQVVMFKESNLQKRFKVVA